MGDVTGNDVSYATSRSSLKKRLLTDPHDDASEHLIGAIGVEGCKKRKTALGLLVRHEEVTIIQLISGKCSITADHLHEIGVSQYPTCPGCG